MLPGGDNITVVVEVTDALGASGRGRTGGVYVLPNTNPELLAAAASAINSSALSQPGGVDAVLSSLLQVSAAAGKAEGPPL
jgi:hypothetical protein